MLLKYNTTILKMSNRITVLILVMVIFLFTIIFWYLRGGGGGVPGGDDHPGADDVLDHVTGAAEGVGMAEESGGHAVGDADPGGGIDVDTAGRV